MNSIAVSPTKENVINTVVLISCASKKLDRPAKAEDLYVSPLFRLSLAYARQLRPHGLFILSAKHHLLRPSQEIAPYNLTLNKMSSSEVREWADRVLVQLQGQADARRDHFIFLAGEKYRRYLVPRLCSVEVPMDGLKIGKQLQFLKNVLNERTMR